MNILFIGIGNMGGAIARSTLLWKKQNMIKDINIFAMDKLESNFEKLRKVGEVETFNSSLMDKINLIFIGVKPNQIEGAIGELVSKIDDKKIVVSMAAGVTLDKLEGILGSDKKIIRIMPNIPITVGEGMTSMTPNKNISQEDKEVVEKILQQSSKIAYIPEEKIDGFIGMAGSSPAFAYIFLEAMSDAGVRYGLTREESYFFASQALIGAGKMVLESKSNPGILKDAVCSPGGTTIEGVCTLEEEGFRNAIIKAVSKTIEKSKEMSKKS